MTEAPGVVAARSLGICIRIIHPGHVTSVGEAATACGVGVEDVVKTLVVRRAEARSASSRRFWQMLASSDAQSRLAQANVAPSWLCPPTLSSAPTRRPSPTSATTTRKAKG